MGGVIGAAGGAATGAYREQLETEGDQLVNRTAAKIDRDANEGAQAAAQPQDQQTWVRESQRSQRITLTTSNDLTNATVREAQQRLDKLGLYKGNINGLYGRRTISAVGVFQQQQDLPVSLALDARTQRELQMASVNPGINPSSGTTGNVTSGTTTEAAPRSNPDAPESPGTDSPRMPLQTNPQQTTP